MPAPPPGADVQDGNQPTAAGLAVKGTWGNHMVPPRAPSFQVVHGLAVVGLSTGKAGLRPQRAPDGLAPKGL